jgi:hypothetical protein
MKMVISGSISIKALPADAIRRLDSIIALGADILIGDAPGIDSLVQRHLRRARYERVTVWHRGAYVRNNVRLLAQPPRRRQLHRPRQRHVRRNRLRPRDLGRPLERHAA